MEGVDGYADAIKACAGWYFQPEGKSDRMMCVTG